MLALRNRPARSLWIIAVIGSPRLDAHGHVTPPSVETYPISAAVAARIDLREQQSWKIFLSAVPQSSSDLEVPPSVDFLIPPAIPRYIVPLESIARGLAGDFGNFVQLFL